MYINDLPQCLSKTKPRLFADDTNLTASGVSVTDLKAAVNSDLENLRKWLIANNKLSLNVGKTEFMLIGLIQIFDYRWFNTSFGLIQVFDYRCEVWDVFSETQSKRLQKLQNRAVRIIMNMSNDTDHSVALKALGWETLKVERKARQK